MICAMNDVRMAYNAGNANVASEQGGIRSLWECLQPWPLFVAKLSPSQYKLNQLFAHSIIQSISHSLAHSLSHSVSHSLTHWLAHSSTWQLAHWLTWLLTWSIHSLTYSLYWLTHSLTTPAPDPDHRLWVQRVGIPPSLWHKLVRSSRVQDGKGIAKPSPRACVSQSKFWFEFFSKLYFHAISFLADMSVIHMCFSCILSDNCGKSHCIFDFKQFQFSH